MFRLATLVIGGRGQLLVSLLFQIPCRRSGLLPPPSTAAAGHEEVRAGEGRLGGGWGLPGKRRHWGGEWQPCGALTPSGRPDLRLS